MHLYERTVLGIAEKDQYFGIFGDSGVVKE